ncbi:MAG: hypothetical protein L0287_05195 [Anaerolineae bacterium]|nr:hypothetical protein [Anaerolineae bacterium]
MMNTWNSGPTLKNVTFHTNSAADWGGGMDNENGSTPSLTNVTLNGNSANTGGGMSNIQSYPTLTSVTFSGNSATTQGGAMHNNQSDPIVRNTILWGNSAPTGAQIHDHFNSAPVVNDSVVQDGYASGTNIITTDPLLGTLGNYGGVTETIPLQAGSSAINQGNPAFCPATDQRGITRPQGAACDIGSYEYYDGIISARETVRVSVDSGGLQGNLDSRLASISADGRYVAFYSNATNFVPGDTNGTYDVFVHDMQTGITKCVSVDSNGVLASNGGGSFNPSISDDGRYIAYYSNASNLVPGDTNAATDIFIYDMQTETTARVSITSGGVQANNSSSTLSISSDGRYIAFQSDATNLVPNDTNAAGDIFVHDLQMGTTTRVSVSSSGVQGNGGSHAPSISADGRYIAFTSLAANLVSGDSNGFEDIFVRDMQTGVTTLVSVSSSGTQGNGFSQDSSISADGHSIAFKSAASNLVSGGTSGAGIFVHNIQTGITTLVSVDSSGVQGNGYTQDPSISSDGRYIAFESHATNLVTGDTNGSPDVFVHDMQVGITTRVSVNSSGLQGNGSSIETFVSADGAILDSLL